MENTVSSNPKNYSFAISYGLFGGPAGAKLLYKMARLNGLQPTPLSEADIVIAHSAGCWLLPNNIRPKLIVYVGMPLNPAKTLDIWREANLTGLRTGRTTNNLLVRLYNVYYMLRQPKRNLDIILHPKVGRPTILAGVPVLFISNRHDPWPRQSDWSTYIASHLDWTFLSMPGSHDDLWENPGRYVDIIRLYADELLAKTGE